MSGDQPAAGLTAEQGDEIIARLGEIVELLKAAGDGRSRRAAADVYADLGRELEHNFQTLERNFDQLQRLDALLRKLRRSS